MPTGLQSLRSAIRALVESNNGRARFRERVVAARSEYFKMADAHEAFQRRRIEYAAGQGEPSGPRAEDWSLDGIPIDGKVRGCWFPPGLRAVDAPPDTCNFPEYLNAFTPTLALKYALLAAIHDADPETIEMIDPWRRLERETTIEAEWFAGLVRWARTLGVDADDDDAGKRLGAWVADVRDDLNVSPTARLLGALADADERGRALAELPRELRMNLAASVQPATAGDAKPEAAGNGAGNNGGEAGAKGAGKRLRHSSDFRSVQWHGVDYTFTATQAAIVKQLWEAYENGTPDVGGDTLLVNAESDTRRMADVFKKHPAWGSMIVEGSTKGTYRLAPDPA